MTDYNDRDEIRLAKQILKGALKQGREVANEVKEFKRGFDELQAAKVTEDIVAKDDLLALHNILLYEMNAKNVLHTFFFLTNAQISKK